MMLLYKVGLTSTPEESRLSLVDELMGVEACFLESSPNFLTIFLAYIFLRDEYTIIPLFNLMTQEKCKFPHHTHFEFLLHFFKKLYSTGIYGGSKHYVINIHLSYKEIVLIFLHK